MRSVGIITFHHVPNFGAFLQAWSLAQVIESLGYLVEVIDYRPPALEVKNKRRGIRAIIPSLGRWRMHRFMHSHLSLTPTLYSRSDVAAYVRQRRYDCLVCGSDQIWMKDKQVGFDRTYYLDVVGSLPTRRIAYAPSCGSMESYAEHSAEVRHLLSGFDAVSARDAHTLHVLASCGVDGAVHVVDPTLLATFDELIQSPPLKGGYVAVAGPLDTAGCEFAREVGSSLDLPIVAVGTRCATADHEYRFVHAGEWLTCIAHARFVVTTLFHGAACAIRLRKPFVALDAGGRGFKLADLLNRFGLGSRFFERADGQNYVMTADALVLDFDEPGTRVQKAVETSLDFLANALNGETARHS